jgi:transcriptional regulator with XRE-family HTH domain
VSNSSLDARALREAMNLTQPEAARRAGISLATWRRAEGNLESVSAKTRASVERVLKGASAGRPAESPAITRLIRNLNASFSGEESALTPTMAMRLSLAFDSLGDDDLFLVPYLDGEASVSEYGVGDCLPLVGLPSSVILRIGGNRAWLERLTSTFRDLGRLLDHAVPPIPQTLAGEYALHAAISVAADQEDDEGPDAMLDMFPGLVRHADWEGDWDRARAGLSGLPLGFPDLTEDELADYLRDGRQVRSRLHPYRWWEPTAAALDEWRSPSSGAARWAYAARQTFQFLKLNRNIVDDVFEADLGRMAIDAARATITLEDRTGFTVHLTVTSPQEPFPKRDDAEYADHVAYGVFEELFRTGCEPGASAEHGVPRNDEDPLDQDDFTGTDARMLAEWQHELRLEGVVPSILDTEGTAIGIVWGDKIAIRITTVHH